MYFCPRCGQSYDSSQCIEDGSLLRCPRCRTSRVLMRGRNLIGLGVIIAMGASLVQPPYVYVTGIVLGGALCVTGLVRSIRQRRARRRSELDDSYLDDLW